MRHHHEMDAISKKLADILSSIMEKVQALLDIDRFYAAVLDPRDDQVIFPFVWNREADGEHNGLKTGDRRPISEDWFLDFLFAQNVSQPVRIEEGLTIELKKQKRKYWPQKPVPKSLHTYPIKGGSGVRAFLLAENFRRENAFGDSGYEYFITISKQIAQAVESERLRVKIERKALLMKEVARLGAKLASKTDITIPQLLDMIHASASEIMDTDNMYIALYHPNPDKPDDLQNGILYGRIDFDLMFVNGKPKSVPSRTPKKGEYGRTEVILLSRKPILIQTRKESEAWYKKQGKKEFIGDPLASWVGVPILLEKQVLGVIATYHAKLNYLYDEDDQEALSMMADSAAVAMKNIELFDSLQQRTKELQSLNESLDQRTKQLQSLHDIGIQITSETDLQKVINLIVKHAIDLTGADVATILTYDSETKQFGIAVRQGKFPTKPPPKPEKAGNTVKLVGSERAIFKEEIDNYKKQLFEDKEEHNIKAAAGIPLLVKKRPVGVLWLNYLEPHPFSDEEKKLISMLANQAAIAIDNATLLEKIREQEKKKYEQKYWEYVQLLTGELSHKMTNVIGDIPEWVRKTKEYIGDDPKGKDARQWQDNIRSEIDLLFTYSERIEDICKQMVVPPEKEFFPLPSAIQEALNKVRSEIAEMETIVEIRNREPLEISSYKEDLTMGLVHIIKNAVQAMDGKGKLIVDYSVDTIPGGGGIQLHLTITDTGPGIPENLVDKIFFPYVTTRQGKGGTGLGLFLAKMRIERMGATIDVTTATGKGTTFSMNLPLPYGEIRSIQSEVHNG